MTTETGMTGDQLFVVALMTLLANVVISWLTNRKADKTSRQVAQLSITVDGRLTQLLGMAESAAHARGKLEGLEAKPGAQPVVVSPVVVTPPPAPRDPNARTRATDKPRGGEP